MSVLTWIGTVESSTLQRWWAAESCRLYVLQDSRVFVDDFLHSQGDLLVVFFENFTIDLCRQGFDTTADGFLAVGKLENLVADLFVAEFNERGVTIAFDHALDETKLAEFLEQFFLGYTYKKDKGIT